MTCIVAMMDKGNLYMGGDGLGVDMKNLTVTPRADRKVFINGPFIMGFTSSFYMGQLLRFKLDPPKQTSSTDDLKYMSTEFIDAVKKCFSDNGYATSKDGGTFLVGYRSQIYMIESDFQVGMPHANYAACGCGEAFALGAMYVAKGTPESRIQQALDAASNFSGGVGAPYTILKLPKCP
jgi:ATP-dependent protease HslVU (ClpYQ) peptidase subunit